MATATYVPIATQTLSTSASSISFSSIPSTYTDLRVVLTSTTSSATNMNLQYNGDTGSNYSFTALIGTGSSAVSTSGNGGYLYFTVYGSTSTTIPQMYTTDIFSYAGSTYKTNLMTALMDANGSGDVQEIVGLWRNTSAITSIKLYPQSGNFNSGTTATLWGI